MEYQKEYAVTMSKVGKGKYQYRQKYPDPLLSTSDKIVLKAVTVTLTKKTSQAWQQARAILKEKIARKMSAGKISSITLKQLKEYYFEYLDKQDKINKDSKYQSHYIYKSHLNIFLNDVDPSIIVENMTMPYFKRYFDKMLETKSWSYANVRRAALWNMFDFGVGYGYLNFNPLQNFRLRKLEISQSDLDVNIEDKYLTDDEYHRLLIEFKKRGRNDYVDFIQFLYYMGLRVGEGGSLRVKDIVKNNGRYYANINGTLMKRHKSGNKRGEFKKKPGAKSESSNRQVYLPPEAVEIYKRHDLGHKFLFVKKTTKNAIETGSINRYLKRIAADAKINPDKLTSHIFRHTHVSKLAEQGVPLEMIKKRVGHSDSKITEEIYYHITGKARINFEHQIDIFSKKSKFK
ncbi:tyrosine-type recombinase/integrase [Lactobacillus taiwanensis]|uniref:tyrosine-type recombinase/integrase n=1 Tax=Lactobacillus taiwanensis TaxID=508451 RepID=UPI000ECFC8AC|nr:site-specific integrase [Lactobacillus taiwanensis]MRM99064.1 site-specific integrase [Lactobacillus taiwanensis]TVV05679.1 site-specific integrase [Lactobacillus paragasseri]